MHASNYCILFALAIRTLIKIVSFVRNPSLMNSVCCAVWASAYRIFPVEPGGLELNKTYIHCSPIHSIMTFSSHQAFCVSFTTTRLSQPCVSSILMRLPSPLKIKIGDDRVPSKNIVNWAEHCLLSRPELPVALFCTSAEKGFCYHP